MSSLQVKQKGTAKRTGSGPGRAFQRVNAEEWIGQKGSWDNSYNATFGDGGWGAKAQDRLGQVSMALLQSLLLPYVWPHACILW